MSEKADLSNASLNVLLTIDGKIYMIAMEKERYQALEMIAKTSAKYAVPTGKTAQEFHDFIGYKER